MVINVTSEPTVINHTGSCNDNQTVMVKMSSSYRISLLSLGFPFGVSLKQILRIFILFLFIQPDLLDQQNNIEKTLLHFMNVLIEGFPLLCLLDILSILISEILYEDDILIIAV